MAIGGCRLIRARLSPHKPCMALRLLLSIALSSIQGKANQAYHGFILISMSNLRGMVVKFMRKDCQILAELM
jgi:hypothetical protein